jgi:protein arginine kinase activator
MPGEHMVCQRCNKNEASIHVTEIINGQMLEVHLCEQCAKEKDTDLTSMVPFSELLAGLADFTADGEDAVKKKLVCPNCHMSWEQFRSSGRLGCEQCYEAFKVLLVPLIKKVHNATHHMGKRPSRLSDKLKIELELKELLLRLKRHIELEEYEEAAQVRDKIKNLETKVEAKVEKKEEKTPRKRKT